MQIVLLCMSHKKRNPHGIDVYYGMVICCHVMQVILLDQVCTVNQHFTITYCQLIVSEMKQVSMTVLIPACNHGMYAILKLE